MYIYRIEHAIESHGPYRTHDVDYSDPRQYNMSAAHTNATHPSMWFDCKYKRDIHNVFSDEYYCGFESIDQLLVWFDGWFDTLSINGFIVVIYESDQVISGVYQSVFVRCNATKVDSMSISEVVEIGVLTAS